MEIHELSALELAASLARGDVGAVEVLEHTEARIAGAGAEVGAFAHATPELAREQAQSADTALAEARRDGTYGSLPPFLGVPCPIKDLNQVAGQPFEAGSALLRGNVAMVDDGVVTLLREAGTVMVGKTTTPEFGFPCYTEPVMGPAARTPWDLTLTAGGSSGGAAAAVAAQVVPVAHASDGGGSIRIPAACCGVVGMKPSRGRVSPGPYAEAGPGLATNGVIGRTVRDSAAFLDWLGTPLPGDTWEAVIEPVDPRNPPSTFLAACDAKVPPLRIGLLLEPLNCDEIDLHPQAREAAERAARWLEFMGHIVEPAPRAMNGQEWSTFMPLWSVAAAQLPLPPHGEEALMPLTRWLWEMGQMFTGADYANAVAGMQALTRKVTAEWADFDVILTPTLAQPPLPPAEIQLADPAADFEAQKRFTPWTSVWNMTGAPSISVPIHRAEVDGVELPFGAMLGGVRPGQEATLFALAAGLESADPWPV